MGQFTCSIVSVYIRSLELDSTGPSNAPLHEGRLPKTGKDGDFSRKQNIAFVALKTWRFVTKSKKSVHTPDCQKIYYPPLTMPFQLIIYPRPPPATALCDVQIMSSLPQHIDARTYPVPTHAKCQMIIRFWRSVRLFVMIVRRVPCSRPAQTPNPPWKCAPTIGETSLNEPRYCPRQHKSLLGVTAIVRACASCH